MYRCSKCGEVIPPKIPSCCQLLYPTGCEVRCFKCYDPSIGKKIGDEQSSKMRKQFFKGKMESIKSGWNMTERRGKW